MSPVLWVSVVAVIAGSAGIAVIAGNASKQGETDLSGAGASASLQGSRWSGVSASSEHSPAAAIAGIASNSAIAGNSGAPGQPAAGEHVGVLEPDDDWDY